MALSFDGSQFNALDSDQTDRPADSVIAHWLAGNLRYIGSDMPGSSATPAVDRTGGPGLEPYIACIDWGIFYAHQITLPRRTTRVYAELLADTKEYGSTSPDQSGDLRMRLISSEGDVLESDVRGVAVPGGVHEYQLSVEPDLQAPGPTEALVLIEFRSDAIDDKTDPDGVVGPRRARIDYTGDVPTNHDEFFEIVRSQGSNVQADILADEAGGAYKYLRFESAASGDGPDVRFTKMTTLRPLATWIRTESDSPSDIRNEALTHNRPLAAQSSIFQIAQEVQSRYSRPVPLTTDSDGGSPGAVDDEATVDASQSKVTLERTTGIISRTSDSDQSTQVEWRVSLQPYAIASEWTPDSDEIVQALVDASGDINFELTAKIEQLQSGDSWSGAASLGSSTQAYKEVPLIPTPQDTRQAFLLSENALEEQRGGVLYPGDINERLAELTSVRVDVDEGSLDQTRPVSIKLQAEITGFTKPPVSESPFSKDAARIAVMYAAPYEVPR